jgi:hypothetical protein
MRFFGLGRFRWSSADPRRRFVPGGDHVLREGLRRAQQPRRLHQSLLLRPLDRTNSLASITCF